MSSTLIFPCSALGWLPSPGEARICGPAFLQLLQHPRQAAAKNVRAAKCLHSAPGARNQVRCAGPGVVPAQFRTLQPGHAVPIQSWGLQLFSEVLTCRTRTDEASKGIKNMCFWDQTRAGSGVKDLCLLIHGFSYRKMDMYSLMYFHEMNTVVKQVSCEEREKHLCPRSSPVSPPSLWSVK